MAGEPTGGPSGPDRAAGSGDGPGGPQLGGPVGVEDAPLDAAPRRCAGRRGPGGRWISAAVREKRARGPAARCRRARGRRRERRCADATAPRPATGSAPRRRRSRRRSAAHSSRVLVAMTRPAAPSGAATAPCRSAGGTRRRRPARSSRAAPRRTAARWPRPTGTCRRRTRRPRSSGAPVSRMLTPRSSFHPPIAIIPCMKVVSTAVPSTMAASTTWPLPDVRASTTPHTMPKASSMPPPPKSPTRLSGGCGRSSGRPMAPRAPGDGDVVHVVAGHLGHGPVLAPARHAAVHEARVAGEARIGADAQALGDAGPEALDERVGLLDQRQHGLDALGVLQVDADRAAAAVHDVLRRVGRIATPHVAGAVDAHDVGAHVGEHHRRERPRADAGDLDDSNSGERSHGDVSPCGVGPRRVYAAEREASATTWWITGAQ